MEKVWSATSYVGTDALVRGQVSEADQWRSFAPPDGRGGCPHVAGVDYAVFFRTSAEFLDPKPTQLQIACSIWALRPTSGT